MRCLAGLHDVQQPRHFVDLQPQYLFLAPLRQIDEFCSIRRN
jgi:hypothetical protein